MLSAYLSLTDNAVRGNVKEGAKFDGPYEERYLKIMGRYASNQERGNRPADYFGAAYHALSDEIQQSDGDPLGDLYMREITYGEHGQFFTPKPIADMMASIIHAPSKSEEGREVVCDPCCGSGVMLMASAKQSPEARLVGIDLDIRCAKMCALNMCFRGLDADVYHGDTLSAEMYTVWTVRFGGFIQEQACPKTPDRLKQLSKELQGQLF
jgi:type I restriction-modification system DNA methylase subunit